jgi:dihydrofolate reductase
VVTSARSEIDVLVLGAAGPRRPGRRGRRLKAQPGKDIRVGGAGLAAGLMNAGLLDECPLSVSPVLLGGGTHFFPPRDMRQEFELVQTRTFGGGVVYVRYARV